MLLPTADVAAHRGCGCPPGTEKNFAETMVQNITTKVLNSRRDISINIHEKPSVLKLNSVFFYISKSKNLIFVNFRCWKHDFRASRGTKISIFFRVAAPGPRFPLYGRSSPPRYARLYADFSFFPLNPFSCMWTRCFHIFIPLFLSNIFSQMINDLQWSMIFNDHSILLHRDYY